MQENNLKKYIPYLFVVLVGAVAIVATLLITSPKTPQKPDDGSSQSSEEEVEELPTASALDIAKIDELMRDYYQAKIENDAETLNKLVDSDAPFSVSELANETQYIAKFDSFYTYVIPGVTEEDFIAYVTYDIFFQGIETGAPSLNHFIVKKTEDGYQIVSKAVSAEISEYVKKTENAKTVKALRNEVETNLKAACDEDADLKELIYLLSGENNETPSEPESTENAESTSETESDKSDSSETESASETESKKE